MFCVSTEQYLCLNLCRSLSRLQYLVVLMALHIGSAHLSPQGCIPNRPAHCLLIHLNSSLWLQNRNVIFDIPVRVNAFAKPY